MQGVTSCCCACGESLSTMHKVTMMQHWYAECDVVLLRMCIMPIWESLSAMYNVTMIQH